MSFKQNTLKVLIRWQRSTLKSVALTKKKERKKERKKESECNWNELMGISVTAVIDSTAGYNRRLMTQFKLGDEGHKV